MSQTGFTLTKVSVPADTVGMLDSGELKKKLDAAGISSNL